MIVVEEGHFVLSYTHILLSKRRKSSVMIFLSRGPRLGNEMGGCGEAGKNKIPIAC